MNPQPSSASAVGHRPAGLRPDTGAVLAVAAAAALPVAAIAPLGMAPLGAIVAVAIAVLIALGKTPRPRLSSTPVAILGALLIWAAVSVLWSVAPDRAPITALRLAVIIIAGGLTVAAATALEAPARGTIRRNLLIGLAATLAVLLAISLTVHGRLILSGAAGIDSLFRNSSDAAAMLIASNRAASVLALLFWPAVFVASRLGLGAIGGLAGATVFLLLTLNSSAPVLALAGGAIVFAAAYFRPRFAAFAMTAGIVLLTTVSPAINTLVPAVGRATEAAQYVDGSLNHRLQIWGFVADRAAQRPFTGWGLDASRALGDTATVDVTTHPDGTQTTAELLPLHPHNALLQVWVELGLPGAVLTAALLVWLVFRISRKIPDRAGRATALATLTSALVVAELSYGFWQGWWQASLWLTAALTTAVVYPAPAKG